MIAWLPDPAAIVVVVTLSGLYLWGLQHARRGNRPFASRVGHRPLLFAGGLLLFLLAFTLPAVAVLPQMLEHVLLAFAVPPLLLLGLPRPVLLPLFERRHPRRIMQVLTRPLPAIVLFLGLLFLWYDPSLFDLTLLDDRLRVLAGLSILFVSLLFWWPVIEPLPSWNRELADLGKLLYLFVGSTALKALGFILAFTPRPMYHLPEATVRLWGLSPLADQQGAGFVMLMAGTIVLLIAATVVCAHLLAEEDQPASYQPTTYSDQQRERQG